MCWGWKYSALNRAKNSCIKFKPENISSRLWAVFSNIKLSGFLYCGIAGASKHCDGRSHGESRITLIYRVISNGVLNFCCFGRAQHVLERVISALSVYSAPIFGHGSSAVRCATRERMPKTPDMVVSGAPGLTPEFLLGQSEIRRFLRSKVDIIGSTNQKFVCASPFFMGRPR